MKNDLHEEQKELEDLMAETERELEEQKIQN